MANSVGEEVKSEFAELDVCAKNNTGLALGLPRVPSILTGPVHPFGSLAALTVPPSERKKPALKYR